MNMFEMSRTPKRASLGICVFNKDSSGFETRLCDCASK